MDVTRALALYPATVAALLVVLSILAPRAGPLALANILSVHLALAAVPLVPVAVVRPGLALRSSLAVLGLVVALRFGGEWLSLPPDADASDNLFLAASWNLELGARAGDDAVEGIKTLDVDIVALQELGPDHARAISASERLAERYPHQALYPDPTVFGMGLLSSWPLLQADFHQDPSVIEAVVDLGGGRRLTVITVHPLAGRFDLVGPLPVGHDSAKRDASLARIRDRVDAAIGRGETVAILGDFNISPTEPAFAELTAGLHDAHAEVGQGPGWTWRPSRLEWMRMGLLRIDHALSSPDLVPVSVKEDCSQAGDHCMVEAWYSVAGLRDADGVFEDAFAAMGDIEALPITVAERTGLVTSIELGQGGGWRMAFPRCPACSLGSGAR